MQPYDLDKAGGPEYFEFLLGGKRYKMVYPTTEELEPMQKMDDAERQEKMYSYISPVDQDAPEFKVALGKARIPVVREFAKMLKKEFGIED